MSKLKIETPTEQVVKGALSETIVTDRQGRHITLRKPGVLAQYRIVEVLGASAKNEVYMGMVLPLLYVAAIDEHAVGQPASKGEVEALIQRLDEAGIEAVVKGVTDHFASPDPEADKTAIKK